MNSSRPVVCGFRLALWLGILLLLIHAIWHPLEPRYRGQRLAVWFKALSTHLDDDNSAEEAQKLRPLQSEAAAAIRHLSGAAWPLAVKYCGAHDSPFMEKIKGWANDQKVFEVHIPSDSDYRQLGIAAFAALGPAGQPAAPELIKLFRVDDFCVFDAASAALNGIGPETIPLLVQTLADPDERLRRGAAYTLGGFEAQAQTAVPALIRSLQDRDKQVRSAAAMALAAINTDAEQVIPALLPCLQDQDARVREFTAIALGHIGEEPEIVVPALFARIELETNAPVLSTLVITPIGRFGTNAKPWSPRLVQLIESNRFGMFSGAALNTLRKIDPETAERLIQKRTNHPPSVTK